VVLVQYKISVCQSSNASWVLHVVGQPTVHLGLARARIFKKYKLSNFNNFSTSKSSFYARIAANITHIITGYSLGFTEDASCTRNKAFMGGKSAGFHDRTGRCRIFSKVYKGLLFNAGRFTSRCLKYWN
jgi:hypothetical protein